MITFNDYDDDHGDDDDDIGNDIEFNGLIIFSFFFFIIILRMDLVVDYHLDTLISLWKLWQILEIMISFMIQIVNQQKATTICLRVFFAV